MLLRVRRILALLLIVLAGLVALLSPAFPALIRYVAWPQTGEKPLNVIVAGIDVDYDWSAATWPYPAKPLDFTYRTDTLLLAQVRPDGTVKLLSIPRDSWVPIVGWRGSSLGKINSANIHGGPEMVKKTVQQLTGIEPDGYVYLTLNALRSVTEAVGGVTVDVTQRMKYDDNAGNLHIDLQPGVQHLSGKQAEDFLRFRHDNLGDIGRVARQQAFLAALSERLRSPLNAWRLPRVVAALHANTQSDLSRAEMGQLLGAALKGPRINSYTVPGDFGWAGNTSIWAVDQGKLSGLLTEQFRDPDDPRGLRLLVLNADAPPGSARALKAQLEALGYRNVTAANDPREAPTTVVEGGTPTARETVLRDVGHGAAGPSAPATGSDLTIRLGRDTPAP